MHGLGCEYDERYKADLVSDPAWGVLLKERRKIEGWDPASVPGTEEGGRRGYAVDEEENHLGAGCIGALTFDERGSIEASLG
ncbi:MAG: hypothetical protein WAN17_04240 [Candidatus Sulfotelmatobacter sp.]|jgi:hypothetical protein